MANPSRATIESEWGKAILILDDLRRYATSSTGTYPAPNATNFISDLNSLETIYAGDWLDESESAVQAVRAALAGTLSPATIAAIHRPFLKQYCKSVINRSNLTSDAEMWFEMYKYFADTPRYVQSRAFTFGTPAAGTNTGNGQILRLTRDKYNFPIESEYVDSKRAICIADENTGTRRGQEVFEVKGQNSARDELERSGSGLSGIIVGKTIDDSILNNPGFRSFGGTAGSDAPTSLSSWTSTDTTGAALTYNSTNYGIDQTNTFRVAPSDGTAGSLVMKVSSRITQKLSAARQIQMDEDTPWLMGVVWNRAVNSASGTLNLRMGGITTTVSVSAQTGWNFTTVPSNIPNGQSCWYRQFAQSDLQFQIEWIQTGGTGILIAEVMVVSATRPLAGGTWYWAVPASVATYAQWRVRDSYTWPDIATGSAKIQNMIHRGFPGVYLPSSNGSSVGWTEP